MDLNSFRQQVLADATVEERVEVNQRHLIDKILARYSTEYTFHRELLQNSNDAGASKVIITFHTARASATASTPNDATTATGGTPAAAMVDDSSDGVEVVGAFPAAAKRADAEQKAKADELRQKYKGLTLGEQCTSISFKNNGRAFTVADWARLKSIASGNPDENKIGFFGVGFYSLFSVCEEPFVVSGNECMAFYWRGDQLFTKKTEMTEPRDADEANWTTFLMQLRDGPSQIPDPETFGRFLATSLAFTANLMDVEVKINDVSVIRLSKRVSDPTPLTLRTSSSGLFGAVTTDKYHLRTPEGILSIQSVDTRIVQMSCDYVRRKPKLRNVVVDAVNEAIGKTIETASAVVGSGLGNLLSGWASSFRRKTAAKQEPAESSPKPASTPKPEAVEQIELEERSEFLFLKIAEASTNSHVSSAMNKQIERATKKFAPKSTNIRVIWNSLAEREAQESSSSSDGQTESVFSQLISFPSQGRVFIGFPTHQTTGCCAHLAAALIPTVERESIDFVDPALAKWNKEILAAFAILCRILYDYEVAPLAQNPRVLENPDSLDRAVRSNAHVLRFFTPHSTTPSPHVGGLLRQIFFACGKQPLQLMTSIGLRDIDDIRMSGNASMAAILHNTPLLPEPIEKEAGEMIAILRQFGYLKAVSIDDVVGDLRARGEFKDAKELGNVLRWWIEYRNGLNVGPRHAEELGRRLAEVLTIRVPVSDFHATTMTTSVESTVGEQANTISATVSISLADASYFINQKITPLSQPSPAEPQSTGFPLRCLPPSLSTQFTQPQLYTMFMVNGQSIWSELPLPAWLMSATKGPRIGTDAEYAEFVLTAVSRHWQKLSESGQATAASILSSQTCIRTTDGRMLAPPQTYFRTANLFGNLPVVDEKLERTLREPFLTAIGVCKRVELQMVFDRLGSELNWDYVQLLKYLVSVKSSLSNQDMSKLRGTKLFPAVGEPAVHYMARDLLAPSDENIALKQPVLLWPNKFRNTSDEAVLLFDLGLRKHPACRTLLQIAASAPIDQTAGNGDAKDNLRTIALEYFIEHYSTIYMAEYMAALRLQKDRFLPAFKPDDGGAKQAKRILCMPNECYANPGCEVFGFAVLERRWRRENERFGVLPDPFISACISRLSSEPPKTHAEAKQVFAYMASRQSEINRGEWTALSRLSFIPIFDKDGTVVVRRVRPTECYFKGNSADYQAAFFCFIDYSGAAGSFLRLCGVRDEPSITDIASMLADKPDHVLQVCGGWEQYLALLRQIAVNADQLHGKHVWKQLQNSKCLVGTREKEAMAVTAGDKQKTEDSSSDGDSDGLIEVEYSLVLPSEVFLVDDSVLARKFKPWCAPTEDLLETLYASLGVKWVGEMVKRTTQPQGAPHTTQASRQLEKLIRDRAPLLLHEFTSMRGKKTPGTAQLVRSAEWLKKHLHVRQVSAIYQFQTFKPTGKSDKSPTTACVLQQNDQARQSSNYGTSSWMQAALSKVSPDTMEKEDWLLLIAPLGKDEWDPFDVANSIGLLALDMCKVKDTLLISTLLTSPLDGLRRKGFPVDRVMRPKAPKQVKAPAPPPPQAQPSVPADDPPSYESSTHDQKQKQQGQLTAEEKIAEKHIKEMFPQMSSQEAKDRVQQAAKESGKNATLQDIISRAANQLVENQQKRDGKAVEGSGHKQEAVEQKQPQQSSSVFDQLRDRFGKAGSVPGSQPPQQPQAPAEPSSSLQNTRGGVPTPPMPNRQPPQQPTAVTPQQTQMLRSSLQQAVKSTVQQPSLRDAQFDVDINEPPPMQTPESVKPFSNSGACAPIPVQRLQLVGRVDNIEVFVDMQAFNNVPMLPTEYQPMLPLFIQVLRVLSTRVFQLDAGALHVFVDRDSPIIAFNRGRALFFNLRFFVALGHADVVGGNSSASHIAGLTQADVYAYWFMTFCHELAHHFVHAHDAAHGFYMSAFAEEYMSKLIKLFRK